MYLAAVSPSFSHTHTHTHLQGKKKLPLLTQLFSLQRQFCLNSQQQQAIQFKGFSCQPGLADPASVSKDEYCMTDIFINILSASTLTHLQASAENGSAVCSHELL